MAGLEADTIIYKDIGIINEGAHDFFGGPGPGRSVINDTVITTTYDYIVPQDRNPRDLIHNHSSLRSSRMEVKYLEDVYKMLKRNNIDVRKAAVSLKTKKNEIQVGLVGGSYYQNGGAPLKPFKYTNQFKKATKVYGLKKRESIVDIIEGKMKPYATRNAVQQGLAKLGEIEKNGRRNPGEKIDKAKYDEINNIIEVRTRRKPNWFDPSVYEKAVREVYIRGPRGPRITSPANLRKKIIVDFNHNNIRARMTDNVVLLRDSSTKLLEGYSNDYTSIAAWYDKSHVVQDIGIGDKQKDGKPSQPHLRDLLTTRGIEYSLTKENHELLVLDTVIANTQTETVTLTMNLPDGFGNDRTIITLGRNINIPLPLPPLMIHSKNCRPKVRNFSILMHFIYTGERHPAAELEGREGRTRGDDIVNIERCYKPFFDAIDRSPNLPGLSLQENRMRKICLKIGVLLDIKRIGDHLQSQEVKAILDFIALLPVGDPLRTALLTYRFGHITGDPCAAGASVLKQVPTVVSVPSRLETYTFYPPPLDMDGGIHVQAPMVLVNHIETYPDADLKVFMLRTLNKFILEVDTKRQDGNVLHILSSIEGYADNSSLISLYIETIISILRYKYHYTTLYDEDDEDNEEEGYNYISVQIGNFLIYELSELSKYLNTLRIGGFITPQQKAHAFNTFNNMLSIIQNLMDYIAPYCYTSTFHEYQPMMHIKYYNNILNDRRNKHGVLITAVNAILQELGTQLHFDIPIQLPYILQQLQPPLDMCRRLIPGFDEIFQRINREEFNIYLTSPMSNISKILTEIRKFEFFENRYIIMHYNCLIKIRDEMNAELRELQRPNDNEIEVERGGGNMKRTSSKKHKKHKKHITGGGLNEVEKETIIKFMEEPYQSKLQFINKLTNIKRKILTNNLFDYQFTPTLKKGDFFNQSSFVHDIENEYKMIFSLYKNADIIKETDLDKDEKDPLVMIKNLYYIYSFFFPESLDLFTYASVMFSMRSKPTYDIEQPTKDSLNNFFRIKPLNKEQVHRDTGFILNLIEEQQSRQVQPLSSSQGPFEKSYLTRAEGVVRGGKKQKESKKTPEKESKKTPEKESSQTIMYKDVSYPIKYGSKGGAYIMVKDKDTQKIKKVYVVPKTDKPSK